MSVINQMLKDLDKRQGEQATGSNVVAPNSGKSTSVRLIVVIVAIILLVNIAGIFAWQLYNENQQLKQQALLFDTPEQVNAERIIDARKLDANKVILPAETSKENASNDPSNNSVINSAELTENKTSEATAIPKSMLVEKQETVQLIHNNVPNLTKSAVSILSKESDTNSVITPSNAIAPEQQISKKIRQNKVVATLPEKVVKNKPSLSISRTQLSPKALADKKIKTADKALENNDITKAEALFEDILLLIPEHETARKKLAALWYGKKAYQDAINLLSQGIALAPQAEEMRLMSARIYYEQGQPRQALNLLGPVSTSERVELQILLANLATAINEYESATAAYQKLLELEPTVGRWWLGLAVSLDSQGQFKSASNAYSQAIAKGNLSSNAMQFARQRISELGE